MKPLTRTDPESIGHYTLLARLGAGGMGLVYLGRSPSNRLVAIKVIRSDHSAEEGYRQRFAREAEMAQRVSGHFSAAVVEADAEAETPWLAVEYVPGPSLSDVVKKNGPLPEASLHALAVGLAEALRAIHDAGLVHRDLKPGNVLLTADGPRVIDFGLARTAEAGGITRTGQLMGTPGYMSPEQTYGHDVSFPSDIFALGGVLFFAATGRDPFGDGPAPALLYRIATGEPDFAQVSSSALRDVIAHCTAKDPADRPTAAKLLNRLAPIAGEAGTDTAWLPPDALEDVRTTERLGFDLASRTRALREKRRRWPLIAGAAAAALVLTAAGAIAAVTLPQSGTADGAAPGPSASASAAPVEGASGDLETPTTGITADDIGEPSMSLADPGGRSVTTLGINPLDGNRLTAGGPELSQVWDLDTGLLSADTVVGENEGTSAVAFASEHAGPWQVRGALATMAGVAFAVPEDEDAAPLRLDAHDVAITDMEFSPDGEVLATASREGEVALFDMTAQVMRPTNRVGPPIAMAQERAGVSWSPDGEWFAVAGGPSPTIVDRRGETELDVLSGSEPVLDIAVSPTGTTIATAGHSRTIDLWEVNTGEAPRRYASMTGHGGVVNRVDFNHDGSLLVSAGLPDPGPEEHENYRNSLAPFDPTARLWNVAEQEEIAVLDAGTGAEAQVASFSPDGSRVAVGHTNGEIAIWDLG
ncbi:WD40 repeat domain-containing serine/threonine protein kinase [Nocardiopsis sediminis]|uniref:WD40 repeat domain-containing serine/threonine protein kinase n=1 Tax=Nocardiopsis sediminis TaxID=1778267 RepID=A0ABV8FJW1_9ACTN